VKAEKRKTEICSRSRGRKRVRHIISFRWKDASNGFEGKKTGQASLDASRMYFSSPRLRF